MRGIETLVAEGRSRKRDKSALPATDEVVISLTTTRWVMEEIQRHAASGRYPRSFSACAEELLRAQLRQIEEERRKVAGRTP